MCSARGHVRFGSKADICAATSHVRFTPNSDRESGHAGNAMSALPPKADMCSALRCLLWANSGHGVVTIRSLHPRWKLSLAALNAEQPHRLKV